MEKKLEQLINNLIKKFNNKEVLDILHNFLESYNSKKVVNDDSLSLHNNANELLSILFSILIISQNIHWISSGENFYSDHLLFEKIYDKAKEHIDQVGEKSVALFGEKSVDAVELTSSINSIVRSYTKDDYEEQINQFNKLEEHLLQVVKSFYNKLKENNKLTMGIDTLLMDISDTHENNIYLLKRRMHSY